MLPRRCCQSKTRVWVTVGKQAQRDFRILGANQCADRSKKFCTSSLAGREFPERMNTPTDLSSLALQHLWHWNAEEDDKVEAEYFNTSKRQKQGEKKKKKSLAPLSPCRSHSLPLCANKQSVSARRTENDLSPIRQKPHQKTAVLHTPFPAGSGNGSDASLAVVGPQGLRLRGVVLHLVGVVQRVSVVHVGVHVGWGRGLGRGRWGQLVKLVLPHPLRDAAAQLAAHLTRGSAKVW